MTGAPNWTSPSICLGARIRRASQHRRWGSSERGRRSSRTQQAGPFQPASPSTPNPRSTPPGAGYLHATTHASPAKPRPTSTRPASTGRSPRVTRNTEALNTSTLGLAAVTPPRAKPAVHRRQTSPTPPPHASPHAQRSTNQPPPAAPEDQVPNQRRQQHRLPVAVTEESRLQGHPRPVRARSIHWLRSRSVGWAVDSPLWMICRRPPSRMPQARRAGRDRVRIIFKSMTAAAMEEA